MKGTAAVTVPRAISAKDDSLPNRVFAGLFGAFCGLLLLKFGNPPIMEEFVVAPKNLWELLFFSPWPISWAYRCLAATVVIGLAAARWRRSAPPWLAGLPALWLIWQLIASLATVDSRLSTLVLVHFVALVACFYLGYFSLSRTRNLWLFWLGLMGGYLIMLSVGWQQHFGGLEATRRYFFLYEYPNLKEIPPGLLKKMTSDRIFGTLFYPNSLAGALLLLMPAMLTCLWDMRRRFTPGARAFLVAAVGLGSLGCLYWSGSKAGWLIFLLLGLIALLRLPFARRHKVLLVTLVLAAGLAGFFLRYAGFFSRGATSVSARFDYWRAAAQTVAARPWFGTGPGTFAAAYSKVKRPESEMSRLVHNDYLEQASDSGLIGFAAYTAFIIAALIRTYPRQRLPVQRGKPEVSSQRTEHDASSGDWHVFAVWLGVLGWSLQGFVEFGLYIPALAWIAFALFGWLLGRTEVSERQKVEA